MYIGLRTDMQKVFFNWLEENHIIKENTVSKCKFLKNERKSKDQLKDDEFNKLVKSIDITKFHEYRDYIVCNLIIDTGMRLNETLHLTINDVDFIASIASNDIHTLSKILGHSSITVTEKSYLDLMDEDFRKKYQRFSPLDP